MLLIQYPMYEEVWENMSKYHAYYRLYQLQRYVLADAGI